jgi:hypothetical protein
MKSRVALLFLGVAFIAAPVFAQGRPDTIPGGGAIQELASELSALTARVAKLEGNIVAADLAGTYSLTGFGSPLSADAISTIAGRATLTLDANGTGRGSGLTCEGSALTLSGSFSGFDCSEPIGDVTWTYADGVITLTFLNDGDQIPFNVALGGRLFIAAFAPFHPSDPSSDHVLFVATRLR